MSTARELTPTQLDFRSAMANLGAAVSVVTTNGPRGRAGLTLSAACSVTDSPPTMLVCVNRSSYTHDIFTENQRACVNVLGSDHEELAMHFAGATDVPMEERLSRPIWDQNPDEAPMLRDAAASLAGRITDQATHGSHSVLFLEIDRVVVREDRGALVYFQRQFHPIGARLPV